MTRMITIYPRELYVECIDAMQTIIGEYADRGAIKIVGDFNAQLPRSNVLVNNWHR